MATVDGGSMLGWFDHIAEALGTPVRRWLLVGVPIIAAVGLHASTGDANWAWGAVPVLVAAGISGGSRFAVGATLVAVAGHTAVDLATEFAADRLAGLTVRAAVMLTLSLTGSAVSLLSRQRDTARSRSAREDSVTGLLNVRSFYEELSRLRLGEVPYAILVVDIAGLRRINERYGHPMGTEAIRILGHVLRRSTKQRDLVGHLGSDEMAVALVGADLEGARAAARRLSELLTEERVALPDDEYFEVHAYYGIATYPGDGEDGIGVLRAAGQAKELAKQQGPDQIVAVAA